MDFTLEINNYLDRLKTTADSLDRGQISNVMNVLLSAYQDNRQVFIMGNGGSASTASHFVCDFNKGISLEKKKKFKLICLNDNVASLMAYANDLSYEDIFVEQLKNYYNEGDLVIGISGSGNSENVLKAIDFANNNNGVTVGLCGYNGGKLLQMAQHNIHVNIDDMQIVEDLHMVMDHLMMKVFYKSIE